MLSTNMGKSGKRKALGITLATAMVIVGAVTALGIFVVYHEHGVTTYLLRHRIPEIIELEYPGYLRKKQFPPHTEVDKKYRAWFKVTANTYNITIAERETTGTYIIAYERKHDASSLFTPQVVVSTPISINPGEQRTLEILDVEQATEH